MQAIFLDVHGVLCDFAGSAMKLLGYSETDPEFALGRANDYGNEFVDLFGGMDGFKQTVSQAGIRFWSEMSLLPWASDLVHCVQALDIAPIAFLTSPSHWTNIAPNGVYELLGRQWPEIPVFTGKAKAFCAGESKFLVDDFDQNVNSFIAAGGHAFHWPNAQRLLEESKAAVALKDLEAKLLNWNQRFEPLSRVA